MIKVSLLQRGNKLLEFLKTASWSYDSACNADYEINFSTLVLFLSLKFHSAKPEYIQKRIFKLKQAKLRVLIVLIDTPNYNSTLQELLDSVPLTVILCRTYEECSKYIRGLDICTKRSSDILRRKESNTDTFLESFPKINKNDVVNLKSAFNNIHQLFRTTEKDLSNVFGFSKVKAKSFLEIAKKPFKKQQS